ncbi:hypothetical protein BY458DRAFT_483132 [Sporodiniella umbellata]|nr:hypothetical protein BY458DRAFT_483132 [Sporodiniella umbellata]
MSESYIVVIGAGVIGLTTALVLKQRGYKHVKVIAQHMPGDLDIQYTSPYAGAHWRTMAGDNQFLQELDTVGYNALYSIAKQYDSLETGVILAPSYDYYQEQTMSNVQPWFQHVVKDFKLIDKEDELLKLGASVGHVYTTVLINSPVYLKWLASQFKKLGGMLERQVVLRDMQHFLETYHERVDAVVNCTGLGAQKLVGDRQLFPTRGQTITVRTQRPIRRTITRVHSQGITYIIPRADGTVILGGTHEKNKSDPFPQGDHTARIIQSTTQICPELVEYGPFQILSLNVGLRPSRKGGPRFENEIMRTKQGHKVLITHAYGHGGFGFQSSWGSAEHTVGLLQKGLESKPKL